MLESIEPVLEAFLSKFMIQHVIINYLFLTSLMRKIILYIATSLDGYIAKNNGDVDWFSKNMPSGHDDFYKSIDTVIMGKNTHDQVLSFGAYPYQDKKSYVFTRNNNQNKDKNVHFVNNVKKLMQEILFVPGLDIWLIGGSQIISTFMNLGFVDEIILSVIPIVLGDGIPLFTNIKNESKLELLKTIDYDHLIQLHYKVLK